MSIVFIHSHYGPTPPIFAAFAAQGRLTILRDAELSDGVIAQAGGIITTMHLDQVAFAKRREALSVFFKRGGRLFFNGHVLKPFVDGLEVYQPLTSPQLRDFQLQKLLHHPVFGPIDAADMTTRQGVAGFYGRGHNPMPKQGRAVTGLGAAQKPIDWEWDLPGGGQMFSHAGNDIWTMAPENSDGPKGLADRVLKWTAGEFAAVAA